MTVKARAPPKWTTVTPTNKVPSSSDDNGRTHTRKANPDELLQENQQLQNDDTKENPQSPTLPPHVSFYAGKFPQVDHLHSVPCWLNSAGVNHQFLTHNTIYKTPFLPSFFFSLMITIPHSNSWFQCLHMRERVTFVSPCLAVLLNIMSWARSLLKKIIFNRISYYIHNYQSFQIFQNFYFVLIRVVLRFLWNIYFLKRFLNINKISSIISNIIILFPICMLIFPLFFLFVRYLPISLPYYAFNFNFPKSFSDFLLCIRYYTLWIKNLLCTSVDLISEKQICEPIVAVMINFKITCTEYSPLIMRATKY